MFGGGGSGIGVGLAVAVVDAEAEAGLPAGARPARLSEVFPPEGRSDASLGAELARIVQLEAMLAAYKADLVVELGYRRPAALDVPAGRPGAAAHVPVDEQDRPELVACSEFLADELAVLLNSSRRLASVLIGQSFALRTRLPRLRAALADGALDWPRARGLLAELAGPAADATDPAVIAAVEAALLPVAGEMSVFRLRELARRELIARDPAAADRRRRQREKAADVNLRGTGEGCAQLSVFTSAERAAAIHDAVDRYARMRQADGDPRPIGQLRVQALEDLVLRPWDTSRPAVTATLTVLAPLGALTHLAPPPGPPGATPPEVGGAPITAAQLRALLEQTEALCPGGRQPPAGGGLSYALTDPDGTLRAVIDHAELRRLAARGCPTHPTGDCDCPILDRPPEVDRYRPTPAQSGYVKTRDRTCRHPGCANRAGWAESAFLQGPAASLRAVGGREVLHLCRRHHRIKTHARGWHFAMTDDGLLTVTTPTGITRTTRPPGRIDHTIAQAAAAHAATRPPGHDPADDPPPF